jgi:hypothetical protein
MRSPRAVLLSLLACSLMACSSSSCIAQQTDPLQTWVPEPSPHTYSTGFNPTQRPLQGVDFEAMPEVDVPDHFDWREVGPGITTVEDQGSCGSCWSFASTAVMQDVFKQVGLPHELSEQWLVSCDKNFYGCGGGDQAYRLPTQLGVVSADQMPYTATNGTCKSGLTYGEKLVSWHYVAGSGGAGSGVPPAIDIARAIYLYGPVSVAVAADNKFMSYRSGVFGPNTTSTSINHLVTLVGYDLPGKYWILKNSWGTSWGETGGFMRINFGVNKVGDEAAFIKTRIPITPVPSDKPTCTLTAQPALVDPGMTSTLTIQGANGATTASIEGTSVDVNGGKIVVRPAQDFTTYRGKVQSPKGDGACEVVVAVKQPCDPIAKADAGTDKRIKWRLVFKESATIGTPALAGHSYSWKSKVDGSTHNGAQWKVTPRNGRGLYEYTVTATTKCGSATDTVLVTVY